MLFWHKLEPPLPETPQGMTSYDNPRTIHKALLSPYRFAYYFLK
jgi:hypothetical protein